VRSRSSTPTRNSHSFRPTLGATPCRMGECSVFPRRLAGTLTGDHFIESIEAIREEVDSMTADEEEFNTAQFTLCTDLWATEGETLV